MARAAQAETVSRIVIAADAERNDMRRFDDRMTVSGDDPDAAGRAAVRVSLYDCDAKSLTEPLVLQVRLSPRFCKLLT